MSLDAKTATFLDEREISKGVYRFESSDLLALLRAVERETVERCAKALEPGFSWSLNSHPGTSAAAIVRALAEGGEGRG